jgi:hypothetical protein
MEHEKLAACLLRKKEKRKQLLTNARELGNQVFSPPTQAAAIPAEDLKINLHKHRLKMQESSAVKMPSTRPLWLPVTTSQTVESPRWFNDLKRVEKTRRPKATPKEVSTELPGMSYTTSETLWEAGTSQKRDYQPLARPRQPLPWYY